MFSVSSNQDDGNWTVITNETSDDGKRYTTTKIDRSQGSEKIDGGVVNYSTLTEQKSSSYHDEGPKCSSRTVQKSHRTSGQEVSKFDNNTIVRTKTSSSHVSRQYKSSGAETNENLNETFITNEKAGSGDVQVVTEHEVRPGSYYTITKRTITQKPETVVSEEYSTSSTTSAYNQDFGKISMEISPTHDAFARSLRAISPEELKSRASSGTITEKSFQERKTQDRSEEIYEIRMDGTRIIRGAPRKDVVEVEVNTGTWTRKSKSSPNREDRFATITKSRSPSPPKTIQRSPSPQKSTVVTEEILITNQRSEKKGKSRSPSPPKTSPTQTRSASPPKTTPTQPRSSSPPKTIPNQPCPPKTITKETQDVTEKKRHSLTSSLTSTTVSRQAYIDSIRKSDDSGDKPRKLSTPDKKTSRETSPTKFSRYDDFISTERSEMIKQRGSRDSSPTSNASDIEYIATNRQITDLDDPEPVSEPKEEKASKKKPLKEKPSFRRSETYKERIRKILGMPEPDEPKAVQTNYDDLYAGKEPVVEAPILKKRISLLGPDNDDAPKLNKKQSNPEMISTNRKQVETKVTRKSSVQDMSTQKRASPVKEVKKKEPQESKIDVIEGIMTLEFEFPKEPPKKVSKFETETRSTTTKTTKSGIQVEELSRKSPEKDVLPRKPSRTETTKMEVDSISSKPEKTIEIIAATNLELLKLHQVSNKSKKDISEACIAMLEHESIKEATPKKTPKKGVTETVEIIKKPIEVVEVVDISQAASDIKIIETSQKTVAENVVETSDVIAETTVKRNVEKNTPRTEITPDKVPQEVPKEASRKSPEKLSHIPKGISPGGPEVPRETKSPEKQQAPKEAFFKSPEKFKEVPKEPKIPEKKPQALIEPSAKIPEKFPAGPKESSYKIPEKLPQAPKETRIPEKLPEGTCRKSPEKFSQTPKGFSPESPEKLPEASRKSPEKLPQALKSPEKAPKEASPKRTFEKTFKKETFDEEPQKKKPETKKKSEMSTLEEFKTDMYAKTALRSPNIVAQVFEFLDAEMSLASETTTEDSRTETEIAEEIEETKKIEIIVNDKRKEKSPDDIRKPIKKPGVPKVEKECPKKTVKSRVVVEKTIELTPKKPVSKPKVVVEKTVELRRRDTPEDVRKTGVTKPKMIVEKTIELKKPKSEMKRPRTLVEKEVQQINILITNETPQTTVVRVKKDDVPTVKSTVRTVCTKTRMQSPEKVKKPIAKPAPKPAEPKTIKRVEKIIQIDNKIKESTPKTVPKTVRKPISEPPKKHIVTKTISLSKIEKPEPKSPTKTAKKTTKVEETVIQKEIPEIFIKIGSSEELTEEARITMDYVRSKSSRDSSPEKIWPIPVSPSEEFGHPRYPDQISEPDDLPKRKKLSTAFEDESAIQKIMEVTDESLLTVTEKVNRFSHTETAAKTPAQKVSRPKFEVTEDLKEDECLLSVSEKVNKFLTTTDVPTIEPTVKTNELSNLRGKVSEKVSKFLVTERVETTKQEEERYKPEMVTELTDEIENHPTEEVRIPEVSEKKTISLKSSEAVRKAKAMFENPVKPDDILSRPSVWEGRRLAQKKAEEGRNVKLTDLGVKKPKEEPKVNGEVTLKSTRLILNERKVQEDELDDVSNTEVPGYMKPLTRQSPEREEVAGCRRHLFRQEEVSRTEVSKPTTIYRPRKSSPEKEEQKEIPNYARPVPKVKEVVKTETITICKPRHSPEKEEPKPSKGTKPATIYKLRQASPEKEEPSAPDDVPGYMRQTETYRHKETRVETTKPTTIYRPKHSPEPEEILKPAKTDPTKRTTSPERDVPGYMKPLQRQEEAQKSHLKSETRTSPERKKSEPFETDDDAPRAGKKFGVVLRRTDSGRNVIVNSTSTTLTERRRSSTTSQTGQVIEDIQDLELLEQMMEKAVGYEQRRRIRAQIRIVRRLISEGQIVRKVSKVKVEEKKSEEVSERKIVRKVSSKVEDKENVSLKNILPEKKEGKSSDCVTSSYGIGPTDENGLPLFGLRALRKSKKENVHGKACVVVYVRVLLLLFCSHRNRHI